MEPQPEIIPAAPEIAPEPALVSNPGAAPGRIFKHDAATRAKWKAEKAARKAGWRSPRPPGRPPVHFDQPLAPPLPGANPGPDPAAPGQLSPAPGHLVSIPWNPNILAPLFEQLLPEAEKWEISLLTKKARKISPAALAIVEENAAWNPVARKSLLTAGPEVAAKWLNKAGIGAENAPEITLALAILAIYSGHQSVSRRLDELAPRAQEPTPAGAIHRGNNHLDAQSRPMEASHSGPIERGPRAGILAD